MDQRKLNKVAAQAIRKLQEEKDVLLEKQSSSEKAYALVSDLVKSGNIVSEETLNLIKHFESKTPKELEVIEKAIELHKSGSSDFSFGSLSDRPQDDGTLDPLTRMLLEEY
jgi:hypothetical protein